MKKDDDEDEDCYKRVQQSLSESSDNRDRLKQMNGVIRLRSKRKTSALITDKQESWDPRSSYYCQLVWGKLISFVQPSMSNHFSGSEILPRLWISDFASTCNLTSLLDRDIKYVVVCVLGLQPVFPEKINYLQIPLIDKETQDIYQFFDSVADHIHNVLQTTDDGILVHCRCGVSRSVTIVCAYLIKHHKMKADEAIKFVQKARPCANPISSFRNQLKTYEQNVQ